MCCPGWLFSFLMEALGAEAVTQLGECLPDMQSLRFRLQQQINPGMEAQAYNLRNGDVGAGGPL